MPKRNLKNLHLRVIAAVDRPCQEHAKAVLIKRAFSADERQHLADSGAALPDGSYPIENAGDLENAIQAFGRAKNPGKVKSHIIGRARALGAVDKLPADWEVKKFEAAAAVAKDIGDGDEGAQSFQDVLAANKFSENVWPCVDALSQSIRSIVGDSSLTGGDRDAAISKGVDQFLQSVRDIAPEVSKQLEPLLVRKKDDHMAKTVEELQSDVTKLEGQVTDLTAKLDASEKAKAKATADQMAAEEECKTAKAALLKATDESITYGGEEIKKSEVGDGPFKIAKGATIEAQNQRLEKRAGEEFPHVVGTAAEKALVLKTVDALPVEDPTRKALETILTAAEKMTAAGFDRIGGQGGVEPTVKAAQGTFEGKVNEVMARDKCSKNQAMSKARSEFPTEFAAAYPESAPAATNAN